MHGSPRRQFTCLNQDGQAGNSPDTTPPHPLNPRVATSLSFILITDNIKIGISPVDIDQTHPEAGEPSGLSGQTRSIMNE
jgi:hypothetical protein